MGDKTIPESAEPRLDRFIPHPSQVSICHNHGVMDSHNPPFVVGIDLRRLESFYPSFVAGIDLPHQVVVDPYNANALWHGSRTVLGCDHFVQIIISSLIYCSQGRMSTPVNTDSGKGLSLLWRQAITWSNQCWLIIRWTLKDRLQWNFSQIQKRRPSKKLHLKNVCKVPIILF